MKVTETLSVYAYRKRPGFYEVVMSHEFEPHHSDSINLGTVSRVSGYEWEARETGPLAKSCRFGRRDDAVRWFFPLAERWVLELAIRREFQRNGDGARKVYR